MIKWLSNCKIKHVTLVFRINKYKLYDDISLQQWYYTENTHI